MKINLYTTYFKSDSIQRQQELDYCLTKNLQNIHINKINIFLDAHTRSSDFYHFFEDPANHIFTNKLNFIKIDRIPSYKDWLEYSKDKNEISVFANADIYFDSSINLAYDILKTNDNNIMCLSRHEVLESEIQPHKNPHWSQDVWILNSKNINNIDFIDDLNIKTSLCRCDNKFAYYFAINGWNLYNLFKEIRCYHKHNSDLRKYNKKDKDIYGHTAFVFPTSSDRPSNIDICIFPKTNYRIKRSYISEFLYD